MALSDQISKGIKATLGAKALDILANAVLIVVFTRYLLTPDEYGLLFFAISIFSVITIFGTLGLPSSIARYVTEYLEEDASQVPHILTASLTIVLLLSGVVGLIVSLGSSWIAELLDEPGLAALLTLGFVYIVLRSLRSYLTKVFQGFNRVDYSAVVTTVYATVRVLAAIGFVLLGYGVVGALAGFIVGFFVAIAIGFGLLYWTFYRTLDRAPEREDGLIRRLVEYSVPLTATRGAGVLDKRVDTILIGVLLNPAAVAFYTIAKQISTVCVTPASALGFTIAPAFGDQKATNHLKRAARLYEQSLENILLLYIPAVVGLVLIAEPMVQFVFGTDYLDAVPVVQVMSLYVLVNAVNRMNNDGLDFLGRARDRAIVKSGTAISNFVLNLLLIPILGVVGAAIATVLTHSVYTGVNTYVISQELPIQFSTAVRTTAKVTAVSVLMGLGVYLLLPYVSGLVTLAGVIAFGVAIWFVSVSLSGLLDIRQTLRILT